MNVVYHRPRGCWQSWTGSLLLLCSLLAGTAPLAAAPFPASPSRTGLSPAASPPVVVSALVLAEGGWWHNFWGPLKSYIGTQRGMIQLGACGMGLALLIIWYRRP